MINIYTASQVVTQCNNSNKVKLSLQEAVEDHRVVRRRGSHIF
jgi:O6-methylguanine-DNA--protein-cysteine methyltransferase